MNKKFLIVLAVSLLINTFFAGYFLAGHIIAKNLNLPSPPSGFPPTSPETMIMEEFASKVTTLSPEGQKIVLEAIRVQKERQGAAENENIIRIFLETREVLLAERFDKEKLLALNKKLDEKARLSISIVGDLVSSIASQLSKEDRIKFFDKIGPLK
jgi:hypothetical protein